MKYKMETRDRLAGKGPLQTENDYTIIVTLHRVADHATVRFDWLIAFSRIALPFRDGFECLMK